MPLIKTIDANGQTYTIKEVLITQRTDDPSVTVKVEVLESFTGEPLEIVRTFAVSDFTAAGQGPAIVTVQNSIMAILEAVAQNKFGV